MKILALAGSKNHNSIHEILAKHVASLFEKSKIEMLDLSDFEVANFSVNKELNPSVPAEIQALAKRIDSTQMLIFSAEVYSGLHRSAFKNMCDCLSRIPNRKTFGKPPIFLLAASSETKVGANVLSTAIDQFARDGIDILESFALPSFHENFKDNQIVNTGLYIELIRKVNHLKQSYFDAYYQDDSFSCGIDPERGGGCGDANEY
jgi:NAD(P)H-dependent FMN reductase